MRIQRCPKPPVVPVGVRRQCSELRVDAGRATTVMVLALFFGHVAAQDSNATLQRRRGLPETPTAFTREVYGATL